MADKDKSSLSDQSKAPEATAKGKPHRPSKWRSMIRIPRLTLVIGESIAVCLLIVAIIAGLLVWRLKSGPVDISFANDYVESALHDRDSGIYASIEKSALYWPDLKGPLLLGVQGGQIADADGQEILSVDEVALSLSKAKLLLGIIEPLSLIITRPSVRIIRSENNDIDFGLGTSDTVVSEKVREQADEQKDLIDGILDLIEDGGPANKQDSPLASLQTLQILDAQVMVEDYKFGASWYFPGFDITFEKDPKGLKSTLELDLPDVKDKPSHFQAELLLDREARKAEAVTTIKNLDLRIFSGKIHGLEILNEQDILLNATLDVVLGENFDLRRLGGTVSSVDGALFFEDLAPVPLPYSDFAVSFDYMAGPQEKLSVDDFALTAKGVTFRGQADMSADTDEQGRITGAYSGPVTLSIDDMPQSAIEPLWPAALEGDSSQEWIVDKMGGGDLTGLKAQASVMAAPLEGGGWDVDVADLVANFGFTAMNMDYRNPLPALTNATGSGVFDLEKDRIDIKIDQAEMGGMTIVSADLGFEEVVAEGKGSVAMDISLEGGLDKIFTYLMTEPIDLKDALDFDIGQVRGDTKMRVKLDFPTKKDLAIEEINMDVSGTVNNGYLPAVIQGLPISGGPFKVQVNNERYTVSGKGALSGRPVVFDWQEYIDSTGKPFRHRAKASITVDPELRDHFGIDLSSFIEGSAVADLVYTGLPGNKAEVDVSVDASAARFFIQSFQYDKQPGAKASARLKAHLDNNELRRITNLTAEAPNFKLDKTDIVFRGSGKTTEVDSARISRFVLGETISNANIDFTPSGQMKIVMDGAFLDLRPFLDKEDRGENQVYEDPPTILSISMDQMRSADLETIQYGKIYADIDDQGRFNQLEMDGIAGEGDIYLRYKPNAQGVRTFRLEADDAGAALRAFDVYKSIRGGKLVIYGEPIRGVYDRNLIGVAEITNFRVVDAPALAQLIGAMSLPGIMATLDGEGLSFSKLEAKFDWLYRKRGALLVLKDGRTSGNALGLTFDGVFDNAAQKVDVSGTIIPLSGINKAIGSIPLLGDILTGGTGAVFAATYSMKGDSQEPDISVNPLSVLTPGILRRVLFE